MPLSHGVLKKIIGAFLIALIQHSKKIIAKVVCLSWELMNTLMNANGGYKNGFTLSLHPLNIM